MHHPFFHEFRSQYQCRECDGIDSSLTNVTNSSTSEGMRRFPRAQLKCRQCFVRVKCWILFELIKSKVFQKIQRIALKNASAMLKNPGFYSLHPDLLIQFLKANCFKVKEELLWNATFKWAQNIINKNLLFKHKHNNNARLFQYHSYNHNYKIWQKSLTQSQSKPSKISNDLSASSSDDEQDIELLEDEDLSNEVYEEDEFDESDHHRNALSDAFTDHTADTDHKEEDEKEAMNTHVVLHFTEYEKKIYDALQPVIPFLRYALMDKQFFIDNVSKYLSPQQRDAVYVHYILPERPTMLFNDNARIPYSNKAFDVVDSNVRLDKAKLLNMVDDWWSHTNFASMSPQWFVVKLPDPSYIVTIHWKNRWGDGETAKDIDLQVSNEPDSYSTADKKWTTFWTFRSEKTSNWLNFQVPQNQTASINPSMYWRFVIKTLYGDNSCRCGLDQIKITNAL
eukprot:1133342_1